MSRHVAASLVLVIASTIVPTLVAAAISPPMLDISRQCDASAGRNTNAMSECVVAESEARSEILRRWGELDDAAAERCVKLSRKAKRRPYTTLANCVTTALDGKAAQPAVPKPTSAK